ncbi:MAG TPA: hypothetical protein VFS00_16900 [Polyangiaceae bacterium]|nr:hypothetical protein [Polyangiaceae bacterium]
MHDDAPSPPHADLSPTPAPGARHEAKRPRPEPAARRPGPAAWVSLGTAAEHLGTSSDALRRLFERRAVRAADGGVEAHVDGVRARKLGRLWRVSLGPSWMPSDAR